MSNKPKPRVGKEPHPPLGTPDCIEKAKADALGSYKRLADTIKKQKAADALKEVHIAFVTALESIPQPFGESDAAYVSRQQALLDKLTSAWARYELEQ